MDQLKVPSDIDASDREDSTVSSVTEDASSFYKKNFDSSWSKQAQNVLSHWHRAKKLRTRDPNSYQAFTPCLMDQVVEEEQQHTATKEHINMFSA